MRGFLENFGQMASSRPVNTPIIYSHAFSFMIASERQTNGKFSNLHPS